MYLLRKAKITDQFNKSIIFIFNPDGSSEENFYLIKILYEDGITDNTVLFYTKNEEKAYKMYINFYNKRSSKPQEYFDLIDNYLNVYKNNVIYGPGRKNQIEKRISFQIDEKDNISVTR